jgi:hypothetical protein
MSKPKVFWVSENRCTGNLKAFYTEDACYKSLLPNDSIFHVREIGPIDWEKVWADYSILVGYKESFKVNGSVVQQLVEKQLAGESEEKG